MNKIICIHVCRESVFLSKIPKLHFVESEIVESHFQVDCCV